jgi:26S proteasome regulatory subunit N11
MERLQRLLQSQMGGQAGQSAQDTPQVDTSEQIYISSLALLKMLKHGTWDLSMRAMTDIIDIVKHHSLT